MDVITLATAAVTYLVTSIKNSKGGEKATDEFSSAVWNWIRPIFIKDDSPVNDLKENPDSQDNQDEIKLKIKKHLEKNPSGINELLGLLQTDASFNQPTFTQNHFGIGDNVLGNKIVNTNN